MAARQTEADPAKSDAEEEHGEVGDPDVQAEELEHGEKDEVCAGRGELKEVLIDSLAVEHALGVRPEIDLVAGEEDWGVGKSEKLEVEEDDSSE